MLTKTLHFDDDVLGVFRSMEWSDDGTLGIITGGQLARDLYVRANKAFDALGGKWDRKAGGIVFKIDPRPQIEGLIMDGTLQVERDGFFETPRAVVERMLELVPLIKGLAVLEPSAGLGAIALVLKDHGLDIADLKLIEKNEDRVCELRKKMFYAECCDFLKYDINGWGLIYMNPPFEEGQDIDHVRHAYELLADHGKMVSVMGEGAFFRTDKKAIKFRDWIEAVNGYSEELPAESFKESGTGVNARLVVIYK
jgi:hypothetical protein